MEKAAKFLIINHIDDGKWRGVFERHCKPYVDRGELEVIPLEVSIMRNTSNLPIDESIPSFDAVFIILTNNYLQFDDANSRRTAELIRSCDNHGVRRVLVNAEHCEWQRYEWIQQEYLWPGYSNSLSDDWGYPERLNRLVSELIEEILSEKHNSNSHITSNPELDEQGRIRDRDTAKHKTLQDRFEKFLIEKGFRYEDADSSLVLTYDIDHSHEMPAITVYNKNERILMVELLVSGYSNSIHSVKLMLDAYQNKDKTIPAYIAAWAENDYGFDIYSATGSSEPTKISHGAFPKYKEATTRVHILAKELGVKSKTIVDKCQVEGLDIKNHMSKISIDLAATIREWFRKGEESLDETGPVSQDDFPSLEKSNPKIDSTVKIFISYSSTDGTFCDRLIVILRGAGYNVSDYVSLRTGMEYATELKKHISEANVFIPLISKNSSDSTSINSEMGYALGNFHGREGTLIFPIILDDVKIPFPLEQFQMMEMPRNWNENSTTNLLDVFKRSVEAIFGKKVNAYRSETDPEEVEVVPEALSAGRNAVGDCETEDDNLGFAPYVEAVAEFLVHGDTQPPLTISVEGEWGTGKSSFMRQLKKEIRKLYTEQGREKCFIVEFDPWRHDKDEALWAAFALKFIQDSASYLTVKKRRNANFDLWKQRFQWKKAWPDVVRVILISVVWILATVAIGIGLWKGIKVGASETLVVPKWIGSFIAVTVSVWGAFGKVKELLGSPLAVDLKKYMKKPDYVSKVSFIETFHKDFNKIIKAYAGNNRIYVFIDDLDRCTVPKAAELMESINLMISDNPNLVFIMGMDREKVAAGLAVKHEKLLDYLSFQKEIGSASGNNKRMRGIRYGYSFIEKFIQIPFTLPIPSRGDIEKMLSEIVGVREKPADPEEEVDSPAEKSEPKPEVQKKETNRNERKEIRKEVMLEFEGDDENFRSVALMVSEAFGNNPRRVKQFVNLFRLRIMTAASTKLIIPEKRWITFAQLGKFVGIGLGWPLFIRDLEQNYSLLDGLVDYAESGKNIDKAGEKIKEWAKDDKLIGLIKSGCFDRGGEKKTEGEYELFSIKGLDVEKLMKVAHGY